MPYLIDGHNLIGALSNLTLNEENDEVKLVQMLRSFAIRNGKKCEVIFDCGLPGGRSRLSTSDVCVSFAHSGQEADSRLIRRVQQLSNCSGWTLVSSDRRLRLAAQEVRMKQMNANDFARLLFAPLQEYRSQNVSNPREKPLSKVEIEEWLEEFGDGN